MSWKPCRGGRIQLDKAVKDSHDYYFKFHETQNFKEKTKYGFKLLKAEIYLMQRTPASVLGQDFILDCLSNTETYKPLLRLIQQ